MLRSITMNKVLKSGLVETVFLEFPLILVVRVILTVSSSCRSPRQSVP